MFFLVFLIYFIGIFFFYLIVGIDIIKIIMDWFVCFMLGYLDV